MTPSPWRLRAWLLLALGLVLGLLLWVTWRLIPPEMVPGYWAAMILQGLTLVPLAQAWFGNNPPELVRGLAVAW